MYLQEWSCKNNIYGVIESHGKHHNHLLCLEYQVKHYISPNLQLQDLINMYLNSKDIHKLNSNLLSLVEWNPFFLDFAKSFVDSEFENK